MIANNINGTIRVFNSIPKVFELKKNTMNYNKLNPSVHYADGFRELVNPILEVNQYKTNIYFDSLRDVFTYNVEAYTDEEILLQENEIEYLRYEERISKGREKYLKLCGEFRLSRNRGNITQEYYEILEDTLEPVRRELVNGQFITAKRKLIAIGSSIISQELYDRFYNSIQSDIDELY